MELLYKCRKISEKRHPEWAYSAVLYEVNTRQFSSEGSFRGVERELERIKRLGVDVIWMMPIFPIGMERRKGSLGSYYSVRDYRAVNPEFGSMDDFKDLVSEAHRLGLKVILDWVPNHTSRDAVWVESNPEWYRFDDVKGEIVTPFDWDDVAQLDYDSCDMRREMVEAMKFWLKEVDVDGFRVDMAMLVPMDFWNEAIVELEMVKGDVFMLAEAEGPEFHERAFDVSYAWELHHLMGRIARGEAGAEDLRDMLRSDAMQFQPEAFRMHFTSNHDENSWNDTEFVRFGGAVRQMAALTFVLPGMPLIYNGQEVGSAKKLEFFEKDAVDWSGGEEFTKLYEELCSLRHSNGALCSGERGGDLYAIDNTEPWRIFAVKRRVGDDVVLGLFNFSAAEAVVRFFDEDFDGEYGQVGSEDMAMLKSGSDFYLPPNGFFVYFK